MPLTAVAGSVALLDIAPAPSGIPAVVPGTTWSLNIDANVKKIPNFQTGRDAAATLEDAELSFTLVYDATSPTTPPHGAAGIDAGLKVLAKLFTDSTRFYAGTFIIGTVGPNISSMEDVLMYPVTASLIGVLVRPLHT